MRAEIIKWIHYRLEISGTFPKAVHTPFKVSHNKIQQMRDLMYPGLADENEYLLVFDDGIVSPFLSPYLLLG